MTHEDVIPFDLQHGDSLLRLGIYIETDTPTALQHPEATNGRIAYFVANGNILTASDLEKLAQAIRNVQEGKQW